MVVINILYCGDSNTIDGITLSILSILKHVKRELHIYILTMEFNNHKALAKNNINILAREVKKINKNSFIKLIDAQKYYVNYLPQANINTRFTPFCMLRLYIDLIPDIPDKILYLDYDVVACQDFNLFYNLNIDNYDFAGALDYYGSIFFRKNIFKRDYINSGVLLFNVKKIKENKLLEKVRGLCHDKKMLLPDQSALNKLSDAKLIISRNYNEQKKLTKDTVFRHFTTTFKFFPYLKTQTIKPWEEDKLHNVLNIYLFDDIIDKYKIIKDVMNNE